MFGLIVDVFDDVVVVVFFVVWVEKYKFEIEVCINKVDGINYINWRFLIEILKEEGIDFMKLKYTFRAIFFIRVEVGFFFF